MSAFSFEDYLQSLKRLVCGKKMPLVQIVKCLNEIGNLDNKLLKKKHTKVVPDGKDSFFFLKSGLLAQVIEMSFDSLVCKIFPSRIFSDFFIIPCNSSYNKIVAVPKCAPVKRRNVKKSELKRKVICFKGKSRNIFFPLCHDCVF